MPSLLGTYTSIRAVAQNNKEKIIAETELTEEKIDNAAELATELGQIYAKAVVDESKSPEIRALRDKAFSIVEDVMNKIERRGHYAFRNQPDVAAKYTFSYKPVKRKKKESVVKKSKLKKKRR